MHWNDYLALGGFSIAALGVAGMRRWLLAAGYACLAAYTLLDKWMPGTLPDNATTAFSAAGFCLILADIVMLLKRRRAAAWHPPR